MRPARPTVRQTSRQGFAYLASAFCGAGGMRRDMDLPLASVVRLDARPESPTIRHWANPGRYHREG
jgi:hypothetical protein